MGGSSTTKCNWRDLQGSQWDLSLGHEYPIAAGEILQTGLHTFLTWDSSVSRFILLSIAFSLSSHGLDSIPVFPFSSVLYLGLCFHREHVYFMNVQSCTYVAHAKYEPTLYQKQSFMGQGVVKSLLLIVTPDIGQ